MAELQRYSLILSLQTYYTMCKKNSKRKQNPIITNIYVTGRSELTSPRWSALSQLFPKSIPSADELKKLDKQAFIDELFNQVKAALGVLKISIVASLMSIFEWLRPRANIH